MKIEKPCLENPTYIHVILILVPVHVILWSFLYRLTLMTIFLGINNNLF